MANGESFTLIPLNDHAKLYGEKILEVEETLGRMRLFLVTHDSGIINLE